MIRVVFFHALLFLAPFIAYAFYLYFKSRDPMQREAWENQALVRLAAAGLVLLIGSFLVFSAFRGADTEANYVPPRFEDGRIIPGHFE